MIYLRIFFTFLRIGFFGFGGGYAMVPLLRTATVGPHGWLTPPQFLASVALGQITPGPVAITATFVGFKAAGLAGAVVATLGMFLPSVLVIYLLSEFYHRHRHNRYLRGALEGVLPAVVGLIAAVAVGMGDVSINGVVPALLAAAVLLGALRLRSGYALLILGSAAAGALLLR
ncbi:MAG: chromate transporter [Thermaerobacter sp.]|jgi:chromate transporter|nr:chromate transporter [Thermaerobacter sp.]